MADVLYTPNTCSPVTGTKSDEKNSLDTNVTNDLTVNPGTDGKITNDILLCVLKDVLIELKIMNKYLEDITGDEKNRDDIY